MFYIRADANETVGTGHMMRCLAIAEEFRRRGESVTFIVADECSEALVKARRFGVICLHSVWNDLEKETEQLLRVIKEKSISVMLIDSYYVTDMYLRMIRRYTKVVYIDDLDAFIYPADLLINYNFYADEAHYTFKYQKAGVHTRFLTGTAYAPLRPEFTGVKREINHTVSKILITSGGADTYNVLGNILTAMENWPWFRQLEYEVILGQYNVHTETLKTQWGQWDNVHLLQNVSNMSDYMKSCDVAVTAGGVTTYEMCACGIPSIMYTLADNQHQIAQSVSEKGLVPWVGDVRNGMQECMQKIILHLEDFMTDGEKRRDVSRQMQELVDGNGCGRLVDKLCEYNQ